MALKILNQIGCDQGITNEAYVRINSYRIDKQQGNIELNYSTFLNADAAKPAINIGIPFQMNINQPIHNIKLNEYFSIPLKKDVEEIITNTFNEITTTQTITKQVPDLSILENINVFEFSYSKLKEKLLVSFDEIEDC